MKPVLVIPVELYHKFNITNYHIVLIVSDIKQIQQALKIAKENNQCLSILCNISVDVVTLINLEIEPSVNIYFNCIFNGDILSVIKSLTPGNKDDFKKYITYLFPMDTPNLVTLLKIFSSFGYKCGLQLDCNQTIDKDTFIEIATYSYLTPVSHAQIEPFGFIKQEIRDKTKYVDLNKYYFTAPDTFAYITSHGEVLLKSEYSELQGVICNSIEELSHIDYSEIAMKYKRLRFYNHFDAEDECSKCSNFKICSGFFKNRFNNCQETLSMIYEMLY